MRWWRSMGNWLPWSSRQRREEDLDREIRAHLELEAEEQQDSGLAAEEARYAAQRALGNATLVKEDVREMWGWSSLERLKQDLRYAARTFGLSAITGVLFGLAPALRVSRANLQECLKAGGRIGGAEMRKSARSALVVSEVALALVLLSGAGLLVKSFWRLLEVRPGFNPESVLAARINLPAVKYPEPHKQNEFVHQLLGRIQGLPGVRETAVSTSDARLEPPNPEPRLTTTPLRRAISKRWESH